MRNVLSTALTFLTALALVAAPVLISIYVAGSQSVHLESRRALALADEVMRRAEETSEQGFSALKLLAARRTRIVCSDDEIALMRQLAISSSYLQSVGRVQGNRLVCSSFGDHGAGFDLGPPDYVSPRGVAVRVAVTLPLAPNAHFIVSELHGYASIIHRDLIFDVQDYAHDLALALVSASNHRVIATRGPYDPNWLDPIAKGAAKSGKHGDFIVAQRRADTLEFIAVAAIPISAANQLARELMAFLVPFGLLCGLALATVFYFMVRRQVSVPSMLRAGLRRGEFFLVYQPVVTLDTRLCVGAEALLRWRRSDGMMIRPDLFIPIAEESGIIAGITRRILDLVERDVPALLQAGPELRISINLSARDLQSQDIVKRLGDLMRRSGIRAGNLTVEATEGALIDVALATPIVHQLRTAGIRVAIDDFGTGYSSLSYLTTLQVDALKIDKSFINTIGTTAPTNSVVPHIIEIAKSLDLSMVAEGVETEAQAEFLRERGVQFAQGFLFAEAMSLENLLVLVRAQAIGRQRNHVDDKWPGVP